MRFPWYLLLFCLVSAMRISAQSDRATLTGTVTDQTGAIAPGASVKAIQVETNLERETQTTSQGDYTIPQLPVGTYRVEISAAGFKTLVRSNIVLTAGSTVRVDGSLEIGQVSESIAVVSQAPLLQTDTAKVTTAVTPKFVEDLPLVVGGAMRSPLDLALIAPEAKNTSNISIGGGQEGGWEMTVDGVTATPTAPFMQKGWTALNSPSVEAITEFSLDTNGYKAEFGHGGGGVITYVSRSGSNEWHGTVYEFLRNDAFDANAFFNNATGAAKPVLKQSDFGFSLGGPIRIPKIYNGKDKTFFFASYEGFRNRTGPVVSFLTIPLPEMYQGDFSNWKDKNGTLIPIYDPATTRPDGKGGYLRDPFAGNQLPTARFSTISKNVIQYATMKPNRPDPAGILNPNPRNNFVDAGGGTINPYDKFSIKADHLLTTKDRLAFLFNWGTMGTFALGRPPGLPIPLNPFSTDDNITRLYRITWDRTITPRILNHVTYGSNYTWRLNASINRDQGWGTKLGLKNTPDPNRQFPQVGMDDYSTWSVSNWGGAESKTWMGGDDLNLIRGAHSLKFGFMYQRDHYNGYGQHTAAGTYSFSRLTTSVPLDQSGRSGNGFASMLLGNVNSGSVSTLRQVSDQWRYYAGYAQDDWRASSKLTINYGVRYEYTPPTVEGYFPDGYSNLDPNLPNPGAGGRPGAMVFAGTGQGRTGTRSLFPGWHGGVSPRFGLAYSLNTRTVARLSASRSFGFTKNTGGSSHYQGFIGDYSWSSTDLSITQPFNWDNGVPAWPKPPFLVPTFLNNQDVPYWQQYDAGRLPEYYNWTLNLQHQLPHNMVVEAGYNATMGHHLTTNLVNMNQVNPNIWQAFVAQLGPQGATNLMSSSITSPAAVAAGIPLPWPGFTGSVNQALRPYPQYRTINTASDGGDRSGNSSYHALVLKFEKRYSSGLTFLNSYALSKMFTDADSADSTNSGSLDNYNRRLEKALSRADQTHVFKFNYSYELPFGKGRKYLSQGVLGHVIGGWRVAGIQTYMSGTPISIAPGYSLPLFSNGGNRVTVFDYTGWRAPVTGSKFDPFVDTWWNPAVFNKTPQIPVPTGVKAGVLLAGFGNATVRNPKMRSPWSFNENTSVARTFQFTEKFHMDFRWEAFNLLNRVRWGGPDSTLTSNTFGLVRSQANTPRQMQFGLKLVF